MAYLQTHTNKHTYMHQYICICVVYLGYIYAHICPYMSAFVHVKVKVLIGYSAILYVLSIFDVALQPNFQQGTHPTLVWVITLR